MRKKILLTCTLAMLLAGIGFAAAPFFLSMGLSAKAQAARSQHDISTLKAGDYIFEPNGRTTPWNEMILIIKDWDDSLYVHMLPTQDGKIPMPDWKKGWGLYGYPKCATFGPEVAPNHKIKRAGYIKCHDPGIPQDSLLNWKWSYAGKAQGLQVADMDSPAYELEGNYLYINH